MPRYPIRYGQAALSIDIPDEFPIETLNPFILSREGAALPEISAEIMIKFEQGEGETLPRRFLLPEGTWIRSANQWTFHLDMELEPRRADYWPTRCVIPVIHFVLYNYGVNLLHASAVEYEGESSVFCGRSGSGKSTLMRTLTDWDKRIHPVTDDRLLVWEEERQLWCTPSFEKLNPFQRWSRNDPLDGACPRVSSPLPSGQKFRLERIYFPRVDACNESSLREMSKAEMEASCSVTGIDARWLLMLNHPPNFLTLGKDADSLNRKIIPLKK